MKSNFWHDTGIGNTIMAGLSGLDLDQDTRCLIEEYGVSNFIIFTRNAEAGPARLASLCNSITELCMSIGIQPLIAIDQEGGPVRRLTPPLFPDMPSAADVTSSADPQELVKKLACITADMLHNAGLNMNLAPVLDLCMEAADNVLRGRCFSSDPEVVARLGSTYIRELQAGAILATAKHFPGIGSVKVDPHLARPVVKSTWQEILDGLIPFQRAVKAGVAAVMTSHVVYTAIDPERPATFSRIIATDMLRHELGFQGLLLSDDLEMKGITSHVGPGEAAVTAFLAGHDICLICNNQDYVVQALSAMRDAVKTGKIPKERLCSSIDRRARTIERIRSKVDDFAS